MLLKVRYRAAAHDGQTRVVYPDNLVVRLRPLLWCAVPNISQQGLDRLEIAPLSGREELTELRNGDQLGVLAVERLDEAFRRTGEISHECSRSLEEDVLPDAEGRGLLVLT